MELKKLSPRFSVCKLEDFSQVDWNNEFVFAGRTDAEWSLVCPCAAVPQNVLEREDGWKAVRVQGVLDFSLIGILSALSAVLAEAGIGIFAVSTFDTDYLLVKEENFDRALAALAEAGHTLV